MIFGATKALYELNEERTDFERRLEQGLVDSHEVEPIALTPTQTLVAGYMARRANDDTALVWASLDTVAAACRVNKRTVLRSLASLCELGVIERAKKAGGHNPVTYRVLLGVEPFCFSREDTVSILDSVGKTPRGDTVSSRDDDDDAQIGHRVTQYKRDTSKEANTPRGRASSSQFTVTEADAALKDFFRLTPPRDPRSLPSLAQQLITETSQNAVGRMSDYQRLSELRRLVKDARGPCAAKGRAPEPVSPLDDDSRDDELAAELAAELADARSRQVTVERKNSEVPV
jgi:hypothetical protein